MWRFSMLAWFSTLRFLSLGSLGLLLQAPLVQAFCAVSGGNKSPGLSLNRQLQHRQGVLGHSTILSQSSPDSSSSSIGDYVQGVHGGKYQFETAGGATFAGQQFAESLYASNDDSNVIMNKDESLPKWVQTMATSAKLGTNIGTAPLENHWPVLSISTNPNQNEPVTIDICNDERSWEYYYSKLIQIRADGTVLDETSILCHELDPETSNSAPIVISPATGHLAPRGGSSNLCDPSTPYSDSATLQVVYNSPIDAPSSNDTGNAWLLVIGTEAETWRYWLDIQ